jgi:hypothetical protein
MKKHFLKKSIIPALVTAAVLLTFVVPGCQQTTNPPVEEPRIYTGAESEEVWRAVAAASPGATIYTTGFEYPAADASTKISGWNIPAGVTVELLDSASPHTFHFHLQYHSTGPGTLKIDRLTAVNDTPGLELETIMLPGGVVGGSTNPAVQVSTLEIGGALWLTGGLDRISGKLTSPGGIVRLLPGTKILTGAEGREAVTVNDTNGGAYFHSIVRNLVTGSSTVTITEAVTFQAVTAAENAAYGDDGALVIDSAAMGLGSGGGRLVINAPGKTVTVKSIDGTGLAAVTVQAGTLVVTGAVTNVAGTAITKSSGASITVGGTEYGAEGAGFAWFETASGSVSGALVDETAAGNPFYGKYWNKGTGPGGVTFTDVFNINGTMSTIHCCGDVGEYNSFSYFIWKNMLVFYGSDGGVYDDGLHVETLTVSDADTINAVTVIDGRDHTFTTITAAPFNPAKLFNDAGLTISGNLYKPDPAGSALALNNEFTGTWQAAGGVIYEFRADGTLVWTAPDGRTADYSYLVRNKESTRVLVTLTHNGGYTLQTAAYAKTGDSITLTAGSGAAAETLIITRK